MRWINEVLPKRRALDECITPGLANLRSIHGILEGGRQDVMMSSMILPATSDSLVQFAININATDFFE